jgi:S-adenosyl-L-methionine hydrolase (adenosine-forming)
LRRPPEIGDGKIRGKVLFVDGFGNVITNIGGEALSGLLDLGDLLVVNGVKATYVTTYCESQRGSIVLLTGSHGMAEISCNGDSASTLLGLSASDNVVISLAGGKHY